MKKDPQNHWFMMVQSNMMKFEWFGGIPDFRKPPHGEIQVRKKINCLGFSVPRRLGKGQSNGSSCEASRLHRLDVWEPTSGSVWWKVADCSAFKGVLFRKKKKKSTNTRDRSLRLILPFFVCQRPGPATTLRPERQAPIHTHGGEGTGEDTHARVPGHGHNVGV